MSNPPSRTSSIDRQQLKALLKCYFLLSTRGRITQSMSRGGNRKPRSLYFVVGMYMLMGLMTGLLVVSTQLDVFTYSVIVHSMTFFVVGMAVTSESGDILFNANESDVLVHRPIHPRTLLLAKSLNLIGFTLILAGALNLFPSFFGLAAQGAKPWFPLVHAFSVILLCVLCGAGVVCTYGLVVRVLDREKFDNFAAWSQVALSVLFIAGYQVVPRLLRRLDGVSLESYARYLFPLPPAWFGGMDSWAAGDHAAASALPLALVGLGVTAALAYLAIGRLAPSYGEGLAKLAETPSNPAKVARVKRQATATRNPILRWWLRDSVELGSFRLAAAYIRRDREIKLRLYPSLSVFIVFPLIGLLDRDRTTFSTFVPLITIWLMGSLPLSALETLRMSSQFAAADLFLAAPLASAAPVFHGVRKAVIYYLLVPATCVATILIVFLAPGGRESLPLALPGLVAMPTLSLLPGLVEEYLPLSRPAARGEQTSRNLTLMVMTMLSMIGVIAVASIAWYFDVLWILIGLELVVVAILHRVLSRTIRNRALSRRE